MPHLIFLMLQFTEHRNNIFCRPEKKNSNLPVEKKPTLASGTSLHSKYDSTPSPHGTNRLISYPCHFIANNFFEPGSDPIVKAIIIQLIESIARVRLGTSKNIQLYSTFEDARHVIV